MDHDQRYPLAPSYLPPHNHWPDNTIMHSQHVSPEHEYEGFAFSNFGQAHPQVGIPQPAAQWPDTATSQPSVYGARTTSSPNGSARTARAEATETASVGEHSIASKKSISSPPPRKTLTDADRRNMCYYAEQHPTKKQTEIGEVFGVERSTVSKVLRQKDKYLVPDDSRPRNKRSGKNPDVERTLLVWIRKMESEGVKLTDEAIKQQACQFIVASGPHNENRLRSYDQVWLDKFKSRNNVGNSAQAGPPISPASPDATSSASGGTLTAGRSPEVAAQPDIKRPAKRQRTPKSTKALPRGTVHDQHVPSVQPFESPSTTVVNSPLPGSSVTQFGRQLWSQQTTRPPSQVTMSPGYYRYRSQVFYNTGLQDPYQGTPLLMPSNSTYPPAIPPTMPPTTSHFNTMPPPPLQPQYPIPNSLPLTYPYYSPQYSDHNHGYQPFPAPEAPTVGQAQEALQTLQRYLRHTQSSLDMREVQMIQQLEGVRLRPSDPDLRGATSHENLHVSPRVMGRMETANVH